MPKVFVFMISLLMATSAANSEPISVAAWNVETFHFFATCKKIVRGKCRSEDRTSSGSSPAIAAVSLRDDYNGIDIFAFSEVVGEEEAEVFAALADEDENAGYKHLIGKSGRTLRVGMIFSSARFELLESSELRFASTSGGSRKPLAAKFRQRAGGTAFWVVAVHLTRGRTESDGSGSGDIRNDAQSQELREWVEARQEPVIVLGDFNYDFDFLTDRRRIGFDTFTKNGNLIWVRPEADVDTNWSGENRDRFPNKILDFVFVNQKAGSWKKRSVVYQRPGDFPDSWRTADHRPVVAFFETDPNKSLNVDLKARLPKLVQALDIALERRAAPVEITAFNPSQSVMEKVARAEAAEAQDAKIQSIQSPETNLGRIQIGRFAPTPAGQSSTGGQPDSDAILKALSEIVAERLARQPKLDACPALHRIELPADHILRRPELRRPSGL